MQLQRLRNAAMSVNGGVVLTSHHSTRDFRHFDKEQIENLLVNALHSQLLGSKLIKMCSWTLRILFSSIKLTWKREKVEKSISV